MPEFLALLAMAAVAAFSVASAINFFARTGFKRAMGYAAYVVCIFLLFWLSGLWVGASKHSWGVLAPLFLLFMACGWCLVSLCQRLWKKYIHAPKRQ